MPQPSSNKVWGIDKRILVVVVLFLILVVPVFPRDKIIYVNGSTDTVTMSTSYNTSVQTYTTQSEVSIKVYKGTLNLVSDSYYNNYYNYWYNNYNNYCAAKKDPDFGRAGASSVGCTVVVSSSRAATSPRGG
jgi:hypothetical protein